jgi:hypothetical protein
LQGGIICQNNAFRTEKLRIGVLGSVREEEAVGAVFVVVQERNMGLGRSVMSGSA